MVDRKFLSIYLYALTKLADFLVNSYLRLINPVVVSPTIAAIGLSFFSYGFTQVGTCLEMGTLQILVVIIFSLVGMGKATYVMLDF